LTGNANTDSFVLSGTGSVSGTIDGGGVATGNTLQARDVANTWTINAGNGGSVNNVNAFTNIGNLVGGNTTDSFQFTATGSLSGTADGGSGGVNTLDYNTQSYGAPVSVSVTTTGASVGFAGTATATGGFDNITAVTGDATQVNSLTG